MSLFRSLFSPRRPRPPASRPARRQGPRPRLERLEDRTLLNATPTKFVVGVNQPVNNTTTFSTLAAAVAHATSGDVIQIEPGSNPGDVSGTQAVAKLTIQGDLAAAGALANVPAFQVSALYMVPGGDSLTLSNVNVGLTGTGEIEFVGSGNISSSAISDLTSSATTGVFFFEQANTSVNSVTNTTFAQQGGTGASLELVQVDISATNPNSNTFTGDTFVANASTGGGNLLLYTSTFVAPSVAVTDKITGSTFVANQGADLGDMLANNAAATGLTVQGNTFVESDTSVASTIAIFVNNGGNSVAQSTTVLNNVINMTGKTPIGIEVAGGPTPGGLCTATINNNRISTGGPANGGTGLEIIQGTAATVGVTVTAQGNDFHNNQTGVDVVYNATGPAPTIDLGGGGVSTGGNDFRGTPAASAAAGAVIATGTNPAAASTINAQNDIFNSTAAPNVSNNALANVAIVTTSPLTGNAAFVQVLYQDLLGRTGNLNSGADAGGFVTQLNVGALSQATVAQDVALSTEALNRFVNGLYLQFLRRAADATGLAFWVALLQKGGTFEQVIVGLVGSAEYALLNGTGLSFVQSLYVNLLGRVGSASDVQGWVNALSTLGVAGVVQAFVNSQEFRTDVVFQFYGAPGALTTLGQAQVFSIVPNLLHRPTTPSAAEVSGWVNSGLSLGAIELAFLSSPEFFSNG